MGWDGMGWVGRGWDGGAQFLQVCAVADRIRQRRDVRVAYKPAAYVLVEWNMSLAYSVYGCEVTYCVSARARACVCVCVCLFV